MRVINGRRAAWAFVKPAWITRGRSRADFHLDSSGPGAETAEMFAFRSLWKERRAIDVESECVCYTAQSGADKNIRTNPARFFWRLILRPPLHVFLSFLFSSLQTSSQLLQFLAAWSRGSAGRPACAARYADKWSYLAALSHRFQLVCARRRSGLCGLQRLKKWAEIWGLGRENVWSSPGVLFSSFSVCWPPVYIPVAAQSHLLEDPDVDGVVLFSFFALFYFLTLSIRFLSLIEKSTFTFQPFWFDWITPLLRHKFSYMWPHTRSWWLVEVNTHMLQYSQIMVSAHHRKSSLYSFFF